MEGSPLAIDERVAWWSESMRELALKWFPRKKARPKKPWLSEEAWNIVKEIAPTRRGRLAAQKQLSRVVAQALFDAWVLVSIDSVKGHEPRTKRRRMKQEDRAKRVEQLEVRLRRVWSARRCLHQASMHEACCTSALLRLQGASRSLVRRDRAQHFEAKADETNKASARNDPKALFNIARELAGKPPARAGAIKDECGNVVTRPEKVTARWTRHFAEVFGAKVCAKEEANTHKPSKANTEKLLCDLSGNVTWDLLLEEVAEIVACKLPKNKGKSPDDLPAEVLQAAEEEGARFLHELLSDIASAKYVPYEWKGGKLVPIWKRKGCPTECSDHRGILLAPHASKVLTGVLSRRAQPAYLKQVGPSQFGSVRGRCTAQANLITRSLIDFARLMEVSAAILYIDLSKAFDVAVREILLGWPPKEDMSPEMKRERLVKAGIAADDADEMVAYIDRTGGILEELGVDPTTRALMSEMHLGAWFSLDHESGEVIVTSRGGRQGCRLGSLVFNMIYGKALAELRAECADDNAEIRLLCKGSSPLWCAPGCEFRSESDVKADGESVLQDATYVDDEALYLAHASPMKLADMIRKLLAKVKVVFKRFGFRINWGRGKTELQMQLRGARAERARQRLLNSLDGMPVVLIEGGEQAVHVVESYKHFGGVAADDGRLRKEIAARLVSASAALKKLRRPLHNKQLSWEVKLQLVKSLVASRHFFGAATWPELDRWNMNKP